MDARSHYRSTDPSTSRKAAEALTNAKVDRVYLALLKLGRATSSEIDESLGWEKNTAGKRLSDLHKENPPRATRTGEERKGVGDFDREQDVWRALNPPTDIFEL